MCNLKKYPWKIQKKVLVVNERCMLRCNMRRDNIQRAMNIIDKYSETMSDNDYLNVCNCLMGVYSERTKSGELHILNSRINSARLLLSQTRQFPEVDDTLRVQAMFAFSSHLGIKYTTETSPGSLGILPCEVDEFFESYRRYLNTNAKIVIRRLEAELMDLQDMRDRIL